MNVDNKPIRIAQIMGKWFGGGVESVVMNYYRYIDKNRIQFDFICDEDSTDIPYDEIEKLGGKVILVSSYQKIFQYQKQIKKVLSDGEYKIVHSHINTLSVFPLRAAKQVGIPIRIAHSHSTGNKKEWKKSLLKSILRPFSKVYATDYMACTEHAGRWLFGNKVFDEGKVFLLNNAIDIEKFQYNEEIRKTKRKELGINDDTLVIGHIGRFVAQKNHTFLIDIFNEVHKQKENSILLLVGQGPLQEKIKEKVYTLGLQNSVMFLGQRSDVNELYQAFDVFVFPSLYEGLGMVVVEAQCAGLPCVVSNEIPNAAKVSNKLKFVGLHDSILKWINDIKESTNDNRIVNLDLIKGHGFDIKTEVLDLEKKYFLLIHT